MPVALPNTCQRRELSSLRFSMKTLSSAWVQFNSLRMTGAGGKHREWSTWEKDSLWLIGTDIYAGFSVTVICSLFFCDFCIFWCTIDATQSPKALLFIKLQKYKDVSRAYYLRGSHNSRHADFLSKKKSSHLSILYIITWLHDLQVFRGQVLLSIVLLWSVARLQC